MWHDLKTIRVYECNPQLMGYRVLVDRLWPRGLRKEALGFFVWEKEIAPSTELRKWFNHEPEKYEEFKRRYLEELANSQEALHFLEEVKDHLRKEDVLLLYGAKDRHHNQALVLKEWLEIQLGSEED